MGKQGRPTDLRVAQGAAERAIEALEEIRQIERVHIAGSVRRRVPIVTDVDLVAVTDLLDASALGEQAGFRWTPRGATAEVDGVRVEVYVASRDILGATMLYATGPGGLNVYMRMKAQRRGWRLSQKGLIDLDAGLRMDAPTGDPWRDEWELFNCLDVPIMDPEQRTYWKEIVGR
jgi:DNA polymerase (family 10)